MSLCKIEIKQQKKQSHENTNLHGSAFVQGESSTNKKMKLQNYSHKT